MSFRLWENCGNLGLLGVGLLPKLELHFLLSSLALLLNSVVTACATDTKHREYFSLAKLEIQIIIVEKV